MKRVICLAVLLMLSGCDNGEEPAASFAGGGFVFNYRLAQAYYGVVVKTERSLPEEAVIEGEFENPAGGDALVVQLKANSGQRKYLLRTPPLNGVKKDVPYKVVVRILEGPAGKEIQRLEKTIKSDVDQSLLPQQPLVLGPGLTINPNYDITKPGTVSQE
jgi:hypothetical protein